MKEDLKGYQNVALVSVTGKCNTYYALYDDGVMYLAADQVLVPGTEEGSCWVGIIQEIMTAEEAAAKGILHLNKEVICRVNVAAYYQRKKRRNMKKELKEEIEHRKLVVLGKLDEKYLASLDTELGKLLKEYDSLGV